ncbi:hypothetical protein CAC42_2408 [Sphaceloma murrayae]|uniref:EthD domain-containing protein n=1 Tax=Sphaceloma murrayae TaxID=2082308 RepID=A0A2K1QVZ9_9PEZI|nr:hypothetical protein CAC42_2408 [Sphaceloma murrayae]
MPASITVLYPQGADFNLDYYLKSHMPLVSKTWTPEGLKSWKVVQLPEDQPYGIQAILEFESMDAFKAASTGESAKSVLGDIPNFCDKQPIFLTGPVVGSG